MEPFSLDRNSPYFTIKYFPQNISELTTNDIKIKQFCNWLDVYKKNSVINRNLNTTKKKVKTNVKDIPVNLEEAQDINLENNDNEMILEEENNENSGKIKNNSIDKSCAIITGNHGVGKSAFVYTILEQKNYDIQVINFEKINQKKNINEFIERTMKGVDIYQSIINKKPTKEKAIVVDNVEIISSPNEKLFITNILKQNEIEWNFPIIFICNNKHNKLINFIKKSSYEIELFSPTVESLMNVVARICLHEKIIFTGEDLYRDLIEHSRRDLRLLLTNLQTIKQIFGKKYLVKKNFKNLLKLVR